MSLCLTLSLCLNPGHVAPLECCLIIGDVNLDYSVRVVSVRFLHHNVTIFPFVINKYLIGGFFETIQIFYISFLFLL